MFMSTSARNLLSLNKKALMEIHKISGMNFDDLFICQEYTENFTLNKVMKKFDECVQRCSFKEDSTNIRDYNVYVLFKRTDWGCKDLMIAQVKNYGFLVTKEEIGCGYLRNINTYWRKADFEKQRKDVNTHWWIIAQPKRMAFVNKKKETSPKLAFETDKYTRYHVNDISYYGKSCGSGQKYVSRITVQPTHRRNDYPIYKYDRYGGIRAEDIDTLIDKSGYFKNNIHDEYTYRANVLRNQKAKQAVDKFDCLKALEPYTNELNRIKDIMYKEAMDKSTWDDHDKLDTVAHIMDNISDFMYKINCYIKVSDNRDWNNQNQVESNLNNFNERLNRLKKIMKEGGIFV